MKNKIMISLAAIMLSLGVSAQTMNDIPLRVVIPDGAEMPYSSGDYVYNKLMSIVANNGVGIDDGASQFFITAKPVVETSDIVGSAPTMFATTMNMYLYIADIFDGKLLLSTQMNIKGAGKSAEKAYLDAVKRLNIKTPGVAQFLKDGRVKIIDYYTSQGATIIAQAMAEAQMNNYERALFSLASIPSVCKAYYGEAQQKMLAVYKQYLDYMGQKYLNEARVVWAATQNRAGAEKAGALLVQIEPDAACRPEAEKLLAQISDRIGQEWTLELRKYSDSVELEKQRIEAARAVGVAYGTHQQPSTTNLGWMR